MSAEQSERERKVTISQAENAREDSMLRAEASALRAALELSEYYHKKYVETLSDKLAKIEVALIHGRKKGGK